MDPRPIARYLRWGGDFNVSGLRHNVNICAGDNVDRDMAPFGYSTHGRVGYVGLYAACASSLRIDLATMRERAAEEPSNYQKYTYWNYLSCRKRTTLPERGVDRP